MAQCHLIITDQEDGHLIVAVSLDPRFPVDLDGSNATEAQKLIRQCSVYASAVARGMHFETDVSNEEYPKIMRKFRKIMKHWSNDVSRNRNAPQSITNV